MAKAHWLQLPVVDDGRARLWVKVACPNGHTPCWAIEKAFAAVADADPDRIALGVLISSLSLVACEPHIAQVVLEALEIADGVHGVKLTTRQLLLGAAACQLPLRDRALLYYTCCDALGYDPADGAPAPQRF